MFVQFFAVSPNPYSEESTSYGYLKRLSVVKVGRKGLYFPQSNRKRGKDSWTIVLVAEPRLTPMLKLGWTLRIHQDKGSIVLPPNQKWYQVILGSVNMTIWSRRSHNKEEATSWWWIHKERGRWQISTESGFAQTLELNVTMWEARNNENSQRHLPEKGPA